MLFFTDNLCYFKHISNSLMCHILLVSFFIALFNPVSDDLGYDNRILQIIIIMMMMMMMMVMTMVLMVMVLMVMVLIAIIKGILHILTDG